MTIIEIEKKELRKSFEKKPYKVKSKSKDSTGETITNHVFFEMLCRTMKEECK